MESSNLREREFIDKWAKNLNSDSLFDIAEAAAYLGESGNLQAVELLAKKAEKTKDWLIQNILVRALGALACKLPDAKTVLEKIILIEPPASGHVLEIKPMPRTPFVLFDFEKGSFFLRGKGTDENVNIIAMFESLSVEFAEFDKTYPDKPFIASFCIKSMSDMFSNELYKFLRRIKLHQNTIVYWYYEIFGDSMTYTGEDYELISKMKFIYLEVPQYGPSIGY